MYILNVIKCHVGNKTLYIAQNTKYKQLSIGTYYVSDVKAIPEHSDDSTTLYIVFLGAFVTNRNRVWFGSRFLIYFNIPRKCNIGTTVRPFTVQQMIAIVDRGSMSTPFAAQPTNVIAESILALSWKSVRFEIIQFASPWCLIRNFYDCVHIIRKETGIQ